MSYDLNLIDKSDQQAQKKSNKSPEFQLSTQAKSTTGDEENSIAKVLDWFNRSTDSLDWPKTEDGPKAKQSFDKHTEINKSKGKGSFRKDSGVIISDRKNEPLNMRTNPLQTQSDELGSTDTDTQETPKEDEENSREIIHSLEVKDNYVESQPPQISHLKSFWEKSNTGHEILISKKQKPGDVSAEKTKDNVSKPQTAPDMPTVPGIYKKKDSDYLQLAESPQVDDRGGSDTEIVSVNRISPQLRTPFQSSARADSISQSRETSAQAKLSDTIPVSPLETDPGSERLHLSQNSPYMTRKQGERQIPPKTQMRRGSSEDPLTMDKSTQSSMSLNEREATSIKERFNSPPTNRHGQPLPLSTAEKIKQLRSFWEKEWKKPPYNIDKLEPCVDGEVGRGANQSKMNYRFTKSEYDLTSLDTIGNDSGSDDKHSDVNYHNLSALPLSQSRDKLSPILRTSQTQFSTLREFWDEARLDTKGSSPFVKLKSPKMKEPISAQLSSQGLKWDDPENYCVPEKPRPAAAKSSPPLPNRSKLPRNRLTLSRVANDGTNNSSNYATVESKWSSKDPNREEKPPKFPSSLGKEIRSTKTRKDSFGRSSTRGNSMRRATSMFLLTDPEEKEREIDVSPVHSQSRKQRQNAERGAPPRRPAEETLTPRVYVPKDYRHYLGMTDETTSHNYLAPAVTDEGSGGKYGYEFDLDGPVRASTPMSLEECYSRGGGKARQRPLWAKYSSSDAGQESSVSSTSETWSNSRNSSNRKQQLHFFSNGAPVAEIFLGVAQKFRERKKK